MLRTLVIIAILAITPLAHAGIACFEVGTGKLLDYCSSCRPGICEHNWVDSNPHFGYSPADIKEQAFTNTEWAVWSEENIRKPAREEAETKRAAIKQKANQLRNKLNLSQEEWRTLKAALTQE